MKTIFKKFFTNSEVIAALCVYNESLNIDSCLSHLEDYVDKIIIFDDGSTDNTIALAKKHPKVIEIIENKNKKKWDECKNREILLKTCYSHSTKKHVWVLCVDADERFENNFLQNLGKIIEKYKNDDTVLFVRFRELWGNICQYRTDGIWDTKKKGILFKLSNKMTFNYKQEHHIPWHYEELNGKEVLLNYNLYHLKMVKAEDRKARANLYNKLDPHKKMQPIGYDYLVDEKGLEITKITPDRQYDISTVPIYYKQ